MSEAGRSEHDTSASTDPVLDQILRNLDKRNEGPQTAVVEQAYRVAEAVHRGQRRKSGDPYISHPLAVATILSELGLTPTTVAAALLHDTLKGTGYTLPQLRRDFGEEIAALVDAFAKLDRPNKSEALEAETVRGMTVAMARDLRVVAIKLADRLDNARTWQYVSQETVQAVARETLEIYAPVAHRLGFDTIVSELEERCLAALYPAANDELARLLSSTDRLGERITEAVKTPAFLHARADLAKLTPRELEVVALAGG